MDVVKHKTSTESATCLPSISKQNKTGSDMPKKKRVHTCTSILLIRTGRSHGSHLRTLACVKVIPANPLLETSDIICAE